MTSMEKPKSITITLGDRKDKKFKSFVVYGSTLDEIERKIRKVLK
jgi:hypothetical protein